MKSRKRLWLLLFPIVICGILVWICVSTLVPIGYPYTQDQQMAMFDQLNASTLKELPPPSGVVETDRRSFGLDNNELGRVLRIEHKINKYTSSSVTEIVNYYDNLLFSKGWKSFGVRDIEGGTYHYYKGTACVGLNVHPSPPAVIDYERYELEIWYDYYSQSFSPPKPNIQLLERLNFGQLEIDFCP